MMLFTTIWLSTFRFRWPEHAEFLRYSPAVEALVACFFFTFVTVQLQVARQRAVRETRPVAACASREPVDHGPLSVAVRGPLLRDLRLHERRVCGGAELLGPDHRRGRECCEPRHDRLQHAAAPRLCLAGCLAADDWSSWNLKSGDLKKAQTCLWQFNILLYYFLLSTI
ncbi:uncharacterized protein LOC123429763 [Hordeum vulgare subsp. vulgare]|uniref:uncharacterized protein LOC123429763 n=1 Tax=Hordeum vulgare subsp. vulgare TaxID=112509 RepID=UPI001D1A5577|nr:uncharacterized protein LOC123429763 [Hordeum vulgare subsp. vulgare]